MKTDLETLQDSFKYGYETFKDSRKEASKVLDYFHNRQYTNQQKNILDSRGQPAETFNVVKLFGRMLQGYYSTVLNTVVVKPVQYQDIPTAGILNDVVAQVFRSNNFEATGDDIKLEGALTGLMCAYVEVEETGLRDNFGRNLRKIILEDVPSEEIVLDPMSRKPDYSDARFIHRFKWLTPDQITDLFGASKEKDLTSYFNHLNIKEAEFANKYNIEFQGNFKKFDNYLIVHTVITDDNGRTWSIFWSDKKELARYEVTFKDVKFPYRIQKISKSNKAEFYGVMREVLPAQDAINQAVIKIQTMVNTQKAFVEENSVEDIDVFTDSFNRVNAVIEVKDLQGIKIEALSREVLDQYNIIDKAFDRIQRVLGINDSFLGMAFASDSGRKVKLQQNSTIVALRYLTGKYEQFYKMLGTDIVNLIKQYYTANQVMRIADETSGDRWIELNKPMMQWSGKMDPQTQQPIMIPVMEEVLDPATDEPTTNEDGSIIVAPVPTQDTEVAFSNVDIEIETAAFNDEDEKNQLMLETVLSGTVGQMLSQANPAGYFKAASLSIKSMKSKNAPDIARLLEETASMLSPQAQQQMQNGDMQAQNGGQGSAKSQANKLPQNTNEGP